MNQQVRESGELQNQVLQILIFSHFDYHSFSEVTPSRILVAAQVTINNNL